MAVADHDRSPVQLQCNEHECGSGIADNGVATAQNSEFHSRRLGYFLVEASYGSKLVVTQQLVELMTADTFRSLLLRVLKHEALKERGADLTLQVGFRLGPEFITVPSADELVTVVLQRFPDIKSLQFNIQPFDSDFIKIEPIRNDTTRRARLFQLLGWAVRIVGAYELLMLAVRLGLRLAGVGAVSGVDTDMAENMAIAEALVQMDSEQLDEVKKLYELDTEDFGSFKAAIKEEQQRRGINSRSTRGRGKASMSAGNADGAEKDSKPSKPWVSSGEEAATELDGSLGKNAASEYDETSKRDFGRKQP